MCSHFVAELHEALKMFVMVDYVRKMAAKKSCKYGEYGSFEHLLFLFIDTMYERKTLGTGLLLFSFQIPKTSNQDTTQ